jgi:predicted ferric reductase
VVSRLRSPAPRPRQVDVALIIVAFGGGLTVGSALISETAGQLRAAGGIAMFLGNLTGLVGTYLALVMFLLVSRLSFVERVLGQDGLLRWHRRLSPWPISLIVAHAFLLTIAYAQATHNGFWHQVGAFVSGYPGMLTAFVGFGLFIFVAACSVFAVRRRLRRETWWAIHLAMYAAFALAFAHEVVLGPSFVNHPVAQVLWSVVWAATAGLVLAYRIGLPVVRTLRHDLRIDQTRVEADGVTSIICTGRNLERLAVSGGQFFEWRFLARGLWWQAHPYTLSARPQPPYVRLTVKAVGDHSSAIATLQRGTRVAIEGPYGAFTTYAARHRQAAIIAGGVGITAARALLEDLNEHSKPVVVLRGSSESHIPLLEEVRQLVADRRGKITVLTGTREEVPVLRVVEALPDLRRRDVYVSGSEEFVLAVSAALEERGVARSAIHSEVYAL